MSETDLQSKIQAALRCSGCYVIKTHGSPFFPKGTADLLVCSRGRWYSIEAKQPGEKETPMQKLRRAEVHAAGGVSVVVYSVEEAMAVITAQPPEP